MNTNEIILFAINNLTKEGDIKGEWVDAVNDTNTDGILTLHMKYAPPVRLNVEIKKELRTMHLPYLEDMARHKEPFLIVAERIFPRVKEELRKAKINYLDANGNMFLLHEGTYINIDGKHAQETFGVAGNRAFTKTGLKVIFQFLINEQLINRTYRDLALLNNTGIGNITNIFNGLKREGFLIQLTNSEQQLNNKKKLLEKWITEYERRLKPSLVIGTYRFLNEEDFYEWKKIPLQNGKTYWGGEPAGALFTNYLRPEELTIYTEEGWTDLIKNYRLIPDRNGNVKIFQKFWKHDEVTFNHYEVHPLLAYADLINKGDRRCTETAQKIYDEYLQDQF